MVLVDWWKPVITVLEAQTTTEPDHYIPTLYKLGDQPRAAYQELCAWKIPITSDAY